MDRRHSPVARHRLRHQADRDRCGTALVHLFTSGPARARRLHGDPHPGNFRLMDDGRLGVLDFGSNQPMPRGWPPRFGPLLAAGRDGDAEHLHRIAASAHLLRPDDVTPACPAVAPRPVPAAAAQ
ncbi:AarF/UbiB family protein [Blastococcus sp. PRF04-17]|uniref:AarF/UbiB family protein n=1 Tax=Blastococcus sp. PRF04-17 TaxID=2933797 RepID=UPI001FF311C5|nr:AarF/UbiB family protein [Blastococcus sp. PRF04-17]UOY01873.1 AarF/UbiB family protein [Blastococcus sp. PRF04-17]